jgi:hypothetical protein
MLVDMTRTTLLTRVISFSVIATLFLAVVQPAWAEEEEEGGSYKDPTIVTDDSTSTPEGVKDIGKKPEKKPIENPVYEKWWFWAAAVGIAGVIVTAAVFPLRKTAPGCTSAYNLGCIGDGR